VPVHSKEATVADIFSAQPGRVVAVTGNGLPMQLIIGNPPLPGLPDSRFRTADGDTFNNFRAIIQSLGIAAQSGVQFMHTLRDYIYVYVFGERVGDLSIGGLAFHSACDDEEVDAAQSATGLERVLQYYQSFRVTSYPLALTVAIGTTLAFDAFLVGANGNIVNPETNLAQFQFQLKYIPNQIDMLPDEES
jgi:hypothetical protein